MNKVYLIDKQDLCPENNNGQYILEVWSNYEQSLNRAKVLDKESKGSSYHIVQEMFLDVTEDEAMDIRYPPSRENGN